MNERGYALAEVLIAAAIVGVVWAAAANVLRQVPPQAARWEEASAMRQRLRVIESRVGRIAAGAGVIRVEVGGLEVRVPSLWPRRLGLLQPGRAGEISNRSVTLISRVDGHRSLTLATMLAGGGGEVTVIGQQGCGSAPLCDLREGDLVLAVNAGGACGLYRVEAVGARLTLVGLMEQGAAEFHAGSALARVRLDVLSFDPGEDAVRRYDGYRSDNVMVDGVRGMLVDWTAHAASLADGPFVGAGPLAYDVDQLALQGLRISIELFEGQDASAARRSSLRWGARAWP